jgi:bifunctional DNA-binding transcriptional regulator/antitoxin component of YhaV-PrlF toxin-antitoxin module
MTVTVKKNRLVVPPSVQRKAGIKTGDRLQFEASAGVIKITATQARTYKPTKSELAAIRKGEAAMARGDSVSLSEFLNGLASKRRKAGTKTNRKVSR